MTETLSSQRFAEIEKLITGYFNTNIVPVINSQYESAMLVSLGDDGLSWEKTMEYSCKKMASSPAITHDLALLSNEFRSAVLNEIGREEYDRLSSSLGGDLANLYIETRLDKLMLDKMKEDKAPHSTMEYIAKKAYGDSLIGFFTGGLTQSNSTDEVRKLMENQYNPSKATKLAGEGLAYVTDMALSGGMGSWLGAAVFIGSDAVARGGLYAYNAYKANSKQDETDENVSWLKRIDKQFTQADTVLSQYVFKSEENVMAGFREEGSKIDVYTDKYIKEVEGKLKKSTYEHYLPIGDSDDEENKVPHWFRLTPDEEFARDRMKEMGINQDRTKKLQPGDVDPDSGVAVPSMILSEYAEEYVAEHTLDASQEYAEKHNNDVAMAPTASQPTQAPQADNGSQAEDIVSKGWSGFLKKFGLDGLGEMFGNHIGTTIAMLPDAIIGFFKGKNTNFTGQNSIVPMASVLAGMFVKNPLLKAVLIGGGGLNLLNKAGHEGLEKAGVMHEQREVQYKRYDDQALDTRVKSPRIVGNVFTADIDGVPQVVQLSQKVIDAYNAGALPLNTLANTILARQDALTASVSQNYEEQQRQEQQTLLRR